MTAPEHSPDVDSELIGLVRLDHDLVVGWCVALDGRSRAWPWLLRLTADSDGAPPGCVCVLCAGHECRGPLPARYLDRIKETP